MEKSDKKVGVRPIPHFVKTSQIAPPGLILRRRIRLSHNLGKGQILTTISFGSLMSVDWPLFLRNETGNSDEVS